MNMPLENSTTSTFSQQLIRNDAGDSGVDLTETGMNNSVQNLLTHAVLDRSTINGMPLANGQEIQVNHPFVSKTASSPVPEQTMNNTRSSMIPLSGVLSAPAPSMHSYYSDFRLNHANHSQQQLTPTLTISDEDEDESRLSSNYNDGKPIDMFLSDMDTSKRLGQFHSLRNRTARMHTQQGNNHSECVSQYLCVDSLAGSIRNTFIQPNSGMRGKTIVCHC
jgi:hypothetical protein